LELGIVQSEAARRLGISTVTLSRWECDKVYPTWTHQADLIAYLSCDPFTDPALGSPKSNEPSSVALLLSAAPTNIGQEVRNRRLQMRKTCKQFAQELGVDVKTLRNWESNRHRPSALLLARILNVLRREKYE